MRHAHQPAVLHYDQDINTKKILVPSKAPPPPLRGTSPAAAGEALWAANRTSALSIAAHPVEKDLSTAKIMQIYTIGGLRASVQGAPSAAARHLPRRGRGGNSWRLA